jgi:GTPase SAR1 family protein
MSKINFIWLFSLNSFNDLELWIKDLKQNSSPDIKIFLIGNKIDLEDDRKVNKESAEKIKNDYEFDYFNETSAKTGFNAKEIFVKAAQILYKDYVIYNNFKKSQNDDSVVVNNDNQKKNKKNCC